VSLCGEVSNPYPVIGEYPIHEDDEPARVLSGHRGEGAVEIVRLTRFQQLEPESQCLGGHLRLAQLG